MHAIADAHSTSPSIPQPSGQPSRSWRRTTPRRLILSSAIAVRPTATCLGNARTEWGIAESWPCPPAPGRTPSWSGSARPAASVALAAKCNCKCNCRFPPVTEMIPGHGRNDRHTGIHRRPGI